MKALTILLSLFIATQLQAQVYELSQVETAPVFAKGKMSSDEFMKYYLNYPQSEYDKGAEGTVTLEYTVDNTGMVSEVKVVNSVSPELDKEALRIASLFPFYTPATLNGNDVSARLRFPVVFKIDESSKVVSNKTPKVTLENNNEEKNPLFVVNDKVLQEDANINPSDIKTIRIVKGQKAVDLYGKRAKDGLILIETK